VFLRLSSPFQSEGASSLGGILSTSSVTQENLPTRVTDVFGGKSLTVSISGSELVSHLAFDNWVRRGGGGLGVFQRKVKKENNTSKYTVMSATREYFSFEVVYFGVHLSIMN